MGPVKSLEGSLLTGLMLCHVPRWTIIPHSRPQSVAEHSFRVAVIHDYFVWKMHDKFTHVPATAAAVYHDFEEASTGDTPSPMKYLRGEPTPLNLETAVLKAADLVEAASYIYMHGNSGTVTADAVDSVLERLRTQLSDYPTLLSLAMEIYQLIITRGV